MTLTVVGGAGLAATPKRPAPVLRWAPALGGVSIPPLSGHLSTGFGLWKGVPHGEATPVVLAGVQT